MVSMLDDWAGADAAVRQLLEVSLTAADDRPLEDILQDVAALAARALSCGYVSVTVLGPRERRDHFVRVGAEQAQPRPGHDVDDASTGRAGGGEPIRPVLAVPVVLRGARSGELCAAQPQGRASFDDADERAAVMIAAGVAGLIERARTAIANRRREQWSVAAAALAKEIVSGRHPDPFGLVVERVAAITEASGVSIIQHGSGVDTLTVVAAWGPSAEDWIGRSFVAPNSITSQVMASGRPKTLSHLGALPSEVEVPVPLEEIVVVPLTGSGSQLGVLTLSRTAGEAPMAAAEIGMIAMFAGTVALALELADTQTRRDQLTLVQERDRIARDLHDHVIQRLYATGLMMQNVGATLPPAVNDRLLLSVDEIDETIKQIRHTIFQLTTPIVSSAASIRRRAETLIDELQPVLGFRARLVSTGPVDFGVGEDVIEDCVAVLREALTNVARHADATDAEVSITVSDARITLEVRDNGRGLGDQVRRSGLANLRARAEQRGGFQQVRSSAEHGTWLLWAVPVSVHKTMDTPN